MPREGRMFAGRDMVFDPDTQLIEQERQKLVYEKIEVTNELITDLTVDPDQKYALHIDNYVKSGSLEELAFALEYVRCES